MTDPERAKQDLNPLTEEEELDEDVLGFDPVAEGVTPAEQWSATDRYGMTATEQEHGESLNERLDEEEPDVKP